MQEEIREDLCPNCGTPLTDGEEVCPTCGQRVAGLKEVAESQHETRDEPQRRAAPDG